MVTFGLLSLKKQIESKGIFMKNQFSGLTVIFIALVAGVLGFFARGLQSPTQAIPPNLDQKNNLKEKFELISKVDFEEFLSLREQKERYEKADEILGKILLIMIHELGIKNGESQLKLLKGHSQKQLSESLEKTTGPKNNVQTKATESTIIAPNSSSWKNELSQISSIQSEKAARDLLKKLEVKDLSNELQKGSHLDKARIDLLTGKFTGQAVFNDPKRKAWQIEMEFKGKIENGNYEGQHEIILLESGKQISRNSGRPTGGTYVGVEGDPNGIFILVRDGSVFFQIYYFQKLEKFYGLIYERNNSGIFEKVGIVRLTRR